MLRPAAAFRSTLASATIIAPGCLLQPFSEDPAMEL